MHKNMWIVYGLNKTHKAGASMAAEIIYRRNLKADSRATAFKQASIIARANIDPAITEFWLFNTNRQMGGTFIPYCRYVPE